MVHRYNAEMLILTPENRVMTQLQHQEYIRDQKLNAEKTALINRLDQEKIDRDLKESHRIALEIADRHRQCEIARGRTDEYYLNNFGISKKELVEHLANEENDAFAGILPYTNRVLLFGSAFEAPIKDPTPILSSIAASIKRMKKTKEESGDKRKEIIPETGDEQSLKRYCKR